MGGLSTEVIGAMTAFEIGVGFTKGPQRHPDVHLTPWLTEETMIATAPTHPRVGVRGTTRSVGGEWPRACRWRHTNRVRARDERLLCEAGRETRSGPASTGGERAVPPQTAASA
ncbi:MAG: hypothetical protein OEW27_05550 [Aquincola sp.]|nr:hypothetical protein [Aquincola sp.]MDH5329394.1 hypothetical protein [Aquincola sp.]